MAEVIVAAVLPVLPQAGWGAWVSVQEMVELSLSMKATYLRLEAKMKTLCALRDDMKDRTTKYKLAEDRTTYDWLNKVNNIKKHEQELVRSFKKKQKSSKLINVRSRSDLSKQMGTMCVDIDKLVKEGHQLRGGPILQGALNEIQQDLKAIRVQRKLHMVYISICISVLVSSCLFILFILGSNMTLCPPSCYDRGLIPRITRFFSSLVSSSDLNVCPQSCYDEGIFPRVTRCISSFIFKQPHVFSRILSRRDGPKGS